MELSERIRPLISALPSDASAITFTRADPAALVEGTSSQQPSSSARDLTVEEVAKEARKAPSTVRGWLIAGDLNGYKLNGRERRVLEGGPTSVPGQPEGRDTRGPPRARGRGRSGHRSMEVRRHLVRWGGSSPLTVLTADVPKALKAALSNPRPKEEQQAA